MLGAQKRPELDPAKGRAGRARDPPRRRYVPTSIAILEMAYLFRDALLKQGDVVRSFRRVTFAVSKSYPVDDLARVALLRSYPDRAASFARAALPNASTA